MTQKRTKKVKLNGSCSQKSTQTSSQKNTQRIRSLKKVLKKLIYSKKGLNKLILLKQVKSIKNYIPKRFSIGPQG